MKKNWFSNFLVLFLLVSCLEEEQIERSYPKVVTAEVTEISSSGALFSGRIESGDLEQIIEYGFVWGEDDELIPKNSFEVSFEKTPTTNSVSTEIQSALRIHVKYFMRFYIKTTEKTIYGNLVDFVSLGSEGPVITKLTPESGVLGDTVIISGRNFIAEPDKILVNFDTEATPVIRRTDTTLVVTVPKTLRLETDQIPVSASILGNVGHAPNPFVLQLSKIVPSITSVYPHSIKACDTITVVGKNFKSTTDLITVRLPYNQQVNLIKATNDSIQFSIKLLPPGEFGFTITSGKFELTSSEDFEELRPQFISVSPAVFDPGGIMTVKVKNFPVCFPIVAAAGGGGAEILLQSEDEVQIKIGEGCYFNGLIAFGVTYGDYFLATPIIPSPPAQIFSIEPNHGTIGQEVVIRGENFGDIIIYSPSLNLISYTATEIKGTVNSVFGVNAPDGYFDVSVGSCGTNLILEDGFRFDPPEIFDFYPKVITSADQNITIEGKNFGPGYGNLVILYGPTVTSASQFISQDNNRIVLSAGALINELNEPLAEVKFSVPITVRTDMGMEAASAANLTVDRDGPWKKLKDFPGTARHGAISFSAGGKGYVGLGRTINYTPVSDLWEFDPTTEDWTKKSSFPAAYGAEINDAVVANDKAYILVMGNQLWQYDPSADVWTQKTDFPGTASSQLIVMGIDNKIYAGGGYYNGTGSHEFWEYDPIVNVWSRKADAPADISNYIPFYQTDGKGYMLSTTFNLEKRRLIYDPVANSWSDQSFNSFIEPGGPWQVIDFENFNILFGAPPSYLQKNVMYKASPGSNSLTPLPFVGPSRNQAAGFSIGEMGYFGLGAYLNEFHDFWKFDPSKF